MHRSASAPKKYEHIDFTPPKSVSEAAAKGLELRAKASPSNRGGLTSEEAGKQGIGSGVQRAVNLKNRDTVSPKVIKQMRGFLSRSEKSSAISPENKGTPWNDKGYVAWLLWGGDPAKAWVAKVIKQMEAADEKAKQKTAYQSDVQESGGIKVLPQGQWEIVAWSELSDYMRDSVWDVYDVSYGSIGKHIPSKEVFGKKYKYLYLIDVDADILPDAFIAYKITHAGFKIALGGTDGTRKAKKAMILKMKELIRQPGWYAEASHKVSAILESAGARPIDDEEVVRKTLKGKQIEWLGDGKYSRQLGKSNISAAKSLYGTPRVAMQVRVARRVMVASDNEPSNPGLWAKVQALTKGEVKSIKVNGKKINGPNEGKGFTVFPSAYANGWASKTYKDLGGGWKKKAGPKSWRSEITPGSPAEDCDAMVSTAWVSPQGKMVFLRGQTHEGFAEKWALRNEPDLHAQIVEYGQNARPHASIWHRVMLDRGWLQLQGLSSIVVPPRPSRKQLENVANFFAGCIADGTNNPDLITLRIIGLHPSLRGKPIEPGEDMYPFDVQERVILSDFIEREASGPVIEDMYESMMERTRRASLIEAWGPTLREARGKAKKDVGHGGLDEWFSGHGGAKGKGEDATWGDWVSISPVTKTLPSGKKVEKGDIVGECGISDDADWKEITKGGEDPLKCMPRQKAHDMPKAERAEKAKAKQRAEKADSSRGKKPTNTPTFDKKKGKKASGIDRVFRSPEPFTGFRPGSVQKAGFKPRGLWYSCGSEWDDWCRYEMPEWITKSPYVYRIEVNLSRMLVIRDDDDFRAFESSYLVRGRGMAVIDWKAVARDYDGIEICPYQNQRRMSSDWYYGWDVASGCIWGSGAFKSVEAVESCGVEKSATVQRIQMKREAAARLRSEWRGDRG